MSGKLEIPQVIVNTCKPNARNVRVVEAKQTATEAIKTRLQTLTGESRSGGMKDMAELVGMPLGTVYRYVRGPGVPPHEFLAAVADRYNVTLDWLFARSETGGLKDAEELEPAWARRLHAKMLHIERRLDEISANELSSEEIVRIAVDAARARPRRAAASRAAAEAPDPTDGETVEAGR